MEYKYISRSEIDTIELAQNIESEKFPNMVICPDGELGSEKLYLQKHLLMLWKLKKMLPLLLLL